VDVFREKTCILKYGYVYARSRSQNSKNLERESRDRHIRSEDDGYGRGPYRRELQDCAASSNNDSNVSLASNVISSSSGSRNSYRGAARDALVATDL